MLQNLKNKILVHGFYLVVIIALVFWIGWGQAIFTPPVPPKIQTKWKTKVVYIEKPAPIVKLEHIPVQPKKKQVYTVPDTLRRQRMEADTLISGIKLNGRQLEIHTISPNGVGVVSNFPIQDLPVLAITVDSEGKVNMEVDEKELKRQRRRKVLRKIGNGVIVVAAFTAGLLL